MNIGPSSIKLQATHGLEETFYVHPLSISLKLDYWDALGLNGTSPQFGTKVKPAEAAAAQDLKVQTSAAEILLAMPKGPLA